MISPLYRGEVDRFGYLIPRHYGNVLIPNAVATFRPGEGPFGRGAVAVEEGTTNLILSPTDFNDAAWTKPGGPTITANVAEALDGTITADKIEDNNTVEFAGVQQSISIPDDSSTYTASIYIRKDQNESRFPAMGIQFQGGTTSAAQVRINTRTGEIHETVLQALTASSVTDVGDYWRLEMAASNNASGNTSMRISFWPAHCTTLTGVLDPSTTGSVILWGLQVENKSFATSFVNGTRSGGKLIYPSSVLPVSEATVSMWVHVPPAAHWPGTFLRRIVSNQNIAGPKGILLFRDSAGGLSLRIIDDNGTARLINSMVMPSEGWHHVAATWSGSTAIIYLDGSEIGRRDDIVLPTSHPGNLLAILGRDDAEDQWNSMGADLLILPYAADATEIAALASGPTPPRSDALLQWDMSPVREARVLLLEGVRL